MITPKLTLADAAASYSGIANIKRARAENADRRISDMCKAIGHDWSVHAIRKALEAHDDAKRMFGWPDVKAIEAARSRAIWASK